MPHFQRKACDGARLDVDDPLWDDMSVIFRVLLTPRDFFRLAAWLRVEVRQIDGGESEGGIDHGDEVFYRQGLQMRGVWGTS